MPAMIDQYKDSWMHAAGLRRDFARLLQPLVSLVLLAVAAAASAQEPTTAGVIIYPGAFVEPRSYAPAAHALAEEGFFVAIVPMPLGVAILGGYRADDVISAQPEVTDWVIAGHSLGGVMAARYAADHPDAVEGAWLIAIRPSVCCISSCWWVGCFAS